MSKNPPKDKRGASKNLAHEHPLNNLLAIRKLSRENDGEPFTGREFHLITLLLMYRNTISFRCFPSLKTLANDMRCARSTAQSAMEGLRKKGHIRTTTSYNNETGANTSNQYWIMVDFEDVKKAMSDECTKEFIDTFHKETIELYEDYLLEYEIPVR